MFKDIRKAIEEFPEDVRDNIAEVLTKIDVEVAESVKAALDVADDYEIVIPEIRISIRKKTT